jgi:hypothetical protein
MCLTNFVFCTWRLCHHAKTWNVFQRFTLTPPPLNLIISNSNLKQTKGPNTLENNSLFSFSFFFFLFSFFFFFKKKTRVHYLESVFWVTTSHDKFDILKIAPLSRPMTFCRRGIFWRSIMKMCNSILLLFSFLFFFKMECSFNLKINNII